MSCPHLCGPLVVSVVSQRNGVREGFVLLHACGCRAGPHKDLRAQVQDEHIAAVEGLQAQRHLCDPNALRKQGLSLLVVLLLLPSMSMLGGLVNTLARFVVAAQGGCSGLGPAQFRQAACSMALQFFLLEGGHGSCLHCI